MGEVITRGGEMTARGAADLRLSVAEYLRSLAIDFLSAAIGIGRVGVRYALLVNDRLRQNSPRGISISSKSTKTGLAAESSIEGKPSGSVIPLNDV